MGTGNDFCRSEAGMEPGVVEIFFDVELVLLELAVDGTMEVDPAHSVGLVKSAPEVSEREVYVMDDAVVGVHRAELDASFVAVATRKNDVATDEECGLQLYCSIRTSTDHDI